MKTTTMLTVNELQYNLAIVDDMKMEFIPVYEYGNLVSMKFRLSDVDSDNVAFTTNITAFRKFDLKAKIRGRHQNIALRLEGDFDLTKTTGHVYVTVKQLISFGRSEIVYK